MRLVTKLLISNNLQAFYGTPLLSVVYRQI